MVVVESENLEKNRQFVERLAAKMAAGNQSVPRRFLPADLAMMGTKALLFVPEDDLAEIQTDAARRPAVHPPVHADDESGLVFRAVNTAFRTAPRETNAQTESLVQALPALTRIVTQATACLQMPGTAALAGRHGAVRRRQRDRTSTSPSTMAGFFW